MTDYKAEAPSKRVDQLGNRPKRFWTEVAFAAVADGFAVSLDKRAVKTPKGEVLTLPNPAVAALVAREWEAVEDYVDYAAMPLTRLGFAAIDHLREPEGAVAEASRYAETDLVAYPSDYPQALIERETTAWVPVIEWFRAELGLEVVQNRSIMHRSQPEATVAGIGALVAAATPYERAGLMAATPLLGSVVLAIALLKGHLSGEAAFEASRVGEAFQAETWGDDAEARQRSESHKVEVVNLEAWFKALR